MIMHVVEQLLELLVRVVDAELFEWIKLQVFEIGHVDDADERSALAFCPVQQTVDADHHPEEHVN